VHNNRPIAAEYIYQIVRRSDGADKRFIGSKMCSALLEKIEKDLITSKSDAEIDDTHYK
jgi:hypothetical protein